MGYFKRLQLQPWLARVNANQVRAAFIRAEADAYLATCCHVAAWLDDSPRLFTWEIIVALEALFGGAVPNPDDPTGGFCDETFAAEFPVVHELCTSPGPDPKKVRTLSTLLFFVEGGQWKVRLSERNHKLDLWSGGATLQEALNGLEKALALRPVPWRKQQLPAYGRK
jgi:hypothetical protein